MKASKQELVLSVLKGSWLDRFWDKVVKLGSECGCWIWSGHETREGYGRMVITKPSNVVFLAHRAMLGLYGVHVPDELNVCHKCDTPICVNPNHLFVSDQRGNVHDMNRKRRHTFGKRIHNAILDDNSVNEIREFFSVDQPYGSQAIMARKYGVHACTISDILAERTWTHLL